MSPAGAPRPSTPGHEAGTRVARSLRDKRLGRRGESVAASYLQSRGMVVLSRNWRCRHGELDLVLTDGGRVIVAEVKTRSSTAFGLPAEAVDRLKAARIRQLAQQWLAEFRVGGCEVRFDVVAILWRPDEHPLIEHIVGAF
ncbi:MAG: YraN family protein [Sciscionella sp.]